MEQDYSAFRPSRIWKRLPAERKQQAAAAFWTDEQSTEQQIEAVGAIAGHMKFRPKSVIGLPLDRKSKYLCSLPAIPDTIAARALISYHLEHQRPMMSVFLDALGIAHDNGLINDETVEKPDADKLRTAAEDLSTKYPAEDVSLYLTTLVSQDPDTWGELAALPQTAAAG